MARLPSATEEDATDPGIATNDGQQPELPIPLCNDGIGTSQDVGHTHPAVGS
jgi:hypothetical protein